MASQRSKVAKRVLAIIFISILGALVISIVIGISNRLRDVEDSYAQWHTAQAVIQYMEHSNGVWPRSWMDLQPYYREGSVSFDEVQRRVLVDFTLGDEEMAELAQAADCDHVSRHVIRLENGRLMHFEGAEPNCLVAEYLSSRLRRRVKAPGATGLLVPFR